LVDGLLALRRAKKAVAAGMDPCPQSHGSVASFHFVGVVAVPGGICPLGSRFVKDWFKVPSPIFTLAFFCASLILCHADMRSPIPLWPDGAPGALGASPNDIPTLTPYLPDPANATGAAMVICPGGGYGRLAPHEGNDYALWLNQHGVTCFVLTYRLGTSSYHHPAEFQDVTRALRWIRAHAADHNIDPHRVGIMGSSAGGHLSATLLTHHDAGDTNSSDPVEHQSSRPDLGILCYPVMTMEGPFVHQGSRDNLLGRNPSSALEKLLSNQLQVTRDTPPCFVWTTMEDAVVPMENSMMFVEALRKNGVPFDFHVYEKGRHGIGLDDKIPFAHPHPWANDCLFWLKQQGYLK
jgi:acetyl esterase/lipase